MTEHKTHPFTGADGALPASPTPGPAGKAMTLDDLPPPDTERWVIRRKAEVVAGVQAGLITLNEACRRYRLSVDEYRSWERLLKAHGLSGLRVTRTKAYRKPRIRG